jgi:hypothetical protein
VALAALTAMVVAPAVSSPLASASSYSGPTLLVTTPAVTATIYSSGIPGDPDWIDVSPSVYVAAGSAPLAIHVRRPRYDRPLRVSASVGNRWRTLPSDAVDGWNGLRDFVHATWTDASGHELLSTSTTWCPNNGARARLTPTARTTSRFLGWCPTHPFMTGMAWGIDAGWAAQLPLGDLTTGLTLTPGQTYHLHIALDARIAGLLSMPPSSRSADITVDAVAAAFPGPLPKATTRPALGGTPGVLGNAHLERGVAAPRLSTPNTHVPANSLPDLVPLPALGITTHLEDGRDLLDFGATVSNMGPGPLVVEGFRAGSAPVMAGYQFFYSHGHQVAYVPSSPLHYDSRPSHQHWHFEDFATYDLVNASGAQVATSGKEAFCLAPTDAINLLIPGAALDPGNGDLSTACGDAGSIWTREVLASGWADTYTQARAGQSMDVTDLPNGTYRIRITANPTGALREKSRTNDVSLRTVILGGVAGARTVSVPPYLGIDTETPVVPGPIPIPLPM